MKVQTSTELSRMLSLQRHSSETRAALDRASGEMSTGSKASKYDASGGNLTRLYTLERMLERVAVHEQTIGLVETKLELTQLGLAKAEQVTSSLAVDMLSAAGRGDLVSASHLAEASRMALNDLVSTLNLDVAGEALFAGTAVGGRAVRPVAEIFERIHDLVEGKPVSEAIEAVIDYFDRTDAGGFSTHAYLGADDDLVAAEIGTGVRLEYAVRATDPGFREALKGHALAALVAPDGALAGATDADRLAIVNAAGEILLEAREGLLGLQARTGTAQETVESAKAQRNAERETYDLARTRMLAADPYEAATVFEAMKSQLENVFTVTARIATLRFANFMR